MSALAQAAPPAVDLQSPEAARKALNVFWRLADSWGLSVVEQATLLGVGRTTAHQWRSGKVGVLDRHVLERLSYLFGIHSALQILLPEPGRSAQWLRRPNTAAFLGGQTALQRMLAGQVADLYVVRQYLDAERGGKA